MRKLISLTVILITAVLMSCEKKEVCYTCITSRLTTISIPVVGYPKSEILEEEDLCNKTREEILDYKEITSGTITSVYNGAVITVQTETECELKND
ncbi:MAG: hypothetical protein ACYDEX_19160 [Mobilitalea sp.]